MDDIVWQDPPAAFRGPKGSRWSKHWSVIEELKAHAGSWALVSSSHSNSVQSGFYQIVRRNNLPIVMRTHKNPETGLIDFYAKWDWSKQVISE